MWWNVILFIRRSDGKWSERYFKNVSNNSEALPEVGDIVEAIGSVNARTGYISFKITSDRTNKKVIGRIEPKDKLKVIEVNAILGNFIWIKFERV